MEAKQKAIQEAYGEHWEAVKNYVDNDGWIYACFWDNTSQLVMEGQGDGNNKLMLRPKSLQGIENNNGWIKIESEADLPKELIFYNACNKHNDFEEVPMFYGLNLSKLENYYKSKIITHYQPIEKPKPPIY